jgi:hypothetical protein
MRVVRAAAGGQAWSVATQPAAAAAALAVAAAAAPASPATQLCQAKWRLALEEGAMLLPLPDLQSPAVVAEAVGLDADALSTGAPPGSDAAAWGGNGAGNGGGGGRALPLAAFRGDGGAGAVGGGAAGNGSGGGSWAAGGNGAADGTGGGGSSSSSSSTSNGGSGSGSRSSGGLAGSVLGGMLVDNIVLNSTAAISGCSETGDIVRSGNRTECAMLEFGLALEGSAGSGSGSGSGDPWRQQAQVSLGWRWRAPAGRTGRCLGRGV